MFCLYDTIKKKKAVKKKKEHSNHFDHEKNDEELIDNRLNPNELGQLGLPNCFGLLIAFRLTFQHSSFSR